MNLSRLTSLCTESLPSPPDSPSMFGSHSRCGDVSLTHAAFTFSSGCHPFGQRSVITNPVCQPSQLLSEPYEAYGASQTTRCQLGPQDLDSADPQSTSVEALSLTGKHRSPSQLLSPDSTSGPLIVDQGSTNSQERKKLNRGAHSASGNEQPEIEVRSEEEEDVHLSTSDGDEDHAGEEKTAAERLAEKRKMKRFRLTHAQTRYLMSEFARQAHPDSGHRRRLSRDIPGLSPRQVQVWFQNRRAKLKRLTIDDQERVMRSRALPEDFNFTPSLNLQHRELPSSYRPIRSSQSQNLALGVGSRFDSHSIQNHKRVSHPNRAGLLYNDVSSNGSQYENTTLSPTSSADDGSQMSGVFFTETESPRITTSSFSIPTLFPGVFAVDSQVQRHPRVSRQQHPDMIPRDGLPEYPATQPGPHDSLASKHSALLWEPDRASSRYHRASNTMPADASYQLSDGQSAHWCFSAAGSANNPFYSNYASRQPGIRPGLSDRENPLSPHSRIQDLTTFRDGAAYTFDTTQRTSVRNALQQEETRLTDTPSMSQSSIKSEDDCLGSPG